MTKQARLWEILGPLFGIAAVVLLFVSLSVVCVECEVSLNDPPGKFARVFAKNRQGLELAAYLTLLATFFLFGFLGYLRNELQKAEGEGGWLSSVAYGGGLVTGAVALIDVVLNIAMVTVADEAVNPEVARTLFVLSYNFGFAFAAPMAALLAATSVVIIRFGWLPWPIGWLGLGLLVVVVALVPYGGAGLAGGVGFVWILLVAVFLLWRSVREITRAGSRA